MAISNPSDGGLGVRNALLMKQVEFDQQNQRDELARYERNAASKSPAARASELSAIADELLQLRTEGLALAQPDEVWPRVCERKASELIVRAIALGAFASPADATLRADVHRAYITHPPANSGYSYARAESPFIVAARDVLDRTPNRPESATYFDGLELIAATIEASACAMTTAAPTSSNQRDARRQLADAIRALVSELRLGKTLALPKRIQHVLDLVYAFVPRPPRTRQMSDGSLLTIEHGLLKSAVRWRGGVRLRPERTCTIRRPDGRVERQVKGAGWRMLSDSPPYPVDDDASNLVRLRDLCAELRAGSIAAGTAEQLEALAQRIFSIDEVAMRTSDEQKRAPHEIIGLLEERIHNFQHEWMNADKRVLKWVPLGMETGGFEKCAAHERAPLHGLLDKFYLAMNAAMPLLSESLRRDLLNLARIFEQATEPRSFWSECGDEALVREVRLLLAAEAESIGRARSKSLTEPSAEPDEPQPANASPAPAGMNAIARAARRLRDALRAASQSVRPGFEKAEQYQDAVAELDSATRAMDGALQAAPADDYVNAAVRKALKELRSTVTAIGPGADYTRLSSNVGTAVNVLPTHGCSVAAPAGAGANGGMLPVFANVSGFNTEPEPAPVPRCPDCGKVPVTSGVEVIETALGPRKIPQVRLCGACSEARKAPLPPKHDTATEAKAAEVKRKRKRRPRVGLRGPTAKQILAVDLKVQGWTHKQIANELGTNESGVSGLLKRHAEALKRQRGCGRSIRPSASLDAQPDD